MTRKGRRSPTMRKMNIMIRRTQLIILKEHGNLGIRYTGFHSMRLKQESICLSDYAKDFIPLNIKRAILYDKLKNRKDFPKSYLMHSSSKGDCHKYGKYCKYHKDYGHLIENCLELSTYFNKLVRQGEIDEYLKKPCGRQQDKCRLDNKHTRSCSNSPGGLDSSETRTRKVIKMIFSGGSVSQNWSYSCKVICIPLHLNHLERDNAPKTPFF